MEVVMAIAMAAAWAAGKRMEPQKKAAPPLLLLLLLLLLVAPRAAAAAAAEGLPEGEDSGAGYNTVSTCSTVPTATEDSV
jgi:hypothetical protein